MTNLPKDLKGVDYQILKYINHYIIINYNLVNIAGY